MLGANYLGKAYLGLRYGYLTETFTFTVDGIVKIQNTPFTFTVDGIIANIFGIASGFTLNGIKLKNPIEFQRDYVYKRTDTIVMSGGSVRDFSGLKKQYILKFKNLNAQQVLDITNIMNLKTPVSFTVSGNGQLNINTTVWPYVGQIVYETLGSDYLATVSISLVEVTP